MVSYSFIPTSAKPANIPKRMTSSSFVRNAPKTKTSSYESKSESSHFSEKSKYIFNIDENKKKIDVSDFNIFNIDTIIKTQLIYEIENIDQMYKELNNALAIIDNGSSKDKIIAKQKLQNIRRRIKDVESTCSLSYYIFRTDDILKEYKKTLSSKNARSFICVDKTTSNKEAIKREELIIKYLVIAREYVDIENYQQPSKKLICPSCSSPDMRRLADEDTTFTCMVCSTEVQLLDDTPSFKDTDRVNMCSRYTYTKKGHFIDAIKKHQGKQNADQNTINSIIKILIEEMNFHSLNKETVTKEQIYMFLQEKQFSSKHYEDLNLLYHMITGKPCPDISMYEQKLLEDFDEQETALDKVYEIDIYDKRMNSLNVYYKLYKLLQRCGHPCRKDDFYILKTKTKKDEHDEKMKKAWEILNWEWIETF